MQQPRPIRGATRHSLESGSKDLNGQVIEIRGNCSHDEFRVSVIGIGLKNSEIAILACNGKLNTVNVLLGTIKRGRTVNFLVGELFQDGGHALSLH